MTITPALEATNHQAPPRYTLAEVELLRVKVAQLSIELAQMQTQRLAADCQALIRETLLRYVAVTDVEHYAIDLNAGLIVSRHEGGA